ncbi:Ni/Fe hydrogenase subunit alpha [Hyalangium minutum]|uniref:Hydrogenase/sulfur reductase, alpha subunit protein n=1 Tax=Hyalangium minutum TaxID=394096 RepID=A0A085WHA0_9BACT|nr:Ni/Fe hydrogenase subunit alpha [Hyalangium minutum]KFE67063.1 hydrogenase/sulfur reductase, alpha subunit protein [Hyalangium minutum]
MTNKTRTLQVDYLTRVEGEASLILRLEGDKATDVRLAIFEPPRFFEALLRGRSYLEAPDITSRICGICPAAYLLSACHAVEAALGVHVDGPLRDLRRLLYCGEWIESHALHVFLLHAPDFLGYPDALSMAKEHGEWVQRGLRIKKAGNTLMSILGGRSIHPINVRVGGFYRVPRRAELEAHLPELRRGRDATMEALEWMARFPFPAFERPYEFVSLSHPHEYPLLGERLVSSEGLDIPVGEWDAHFVEEQVPYSSALHARRVGRGAYLCGPLARFNLHFDQLAPEVQEAAHWVGLSVPCRNPFRTLLVRLVEVLQSFTTAIHLIEDYEEPPAPHVDTPPRAGTGVGATEAPRGLLYHRYTLDSEGTIQEARIVPPTSQNQLSIEEDLRTLAPELATRPLGDATLLAERAIRNHDPCISCATHFLTLKREQI